MGQPRLQVHRAEDLFVKDLFAPLQELGRSSIKDSETVGGEIRDGR